MTRIIALNVPQVKPTRNTARPAGRFGAGILASRPSYRTSYTASDDAWWLAERAAAEDKHFDRMAAEFEAASRIEAGTVL